MPAQTTMGGGAPASGDSVSVDMARKILDVARKEMAKRIVGQSEMIDGLLTALIAGGHILLE